MLSRSPFIICRLPQFATRLTLCAAECLKNLNMFGEAAGRLLQMTSEESDLRSALLLEEASYCFIKSRKPYMPRKYAFHLVLAGHRFSKAGQKKHSLRCYRQAYQVNELLIIKIKRFYLFHLSLTIYLFRYTKIKTGV